ncbi:hypothetical protein WN48_08806 [Eufriesea mexicana]|uniref:Uncharacterized protein n=1 Tax=Eufriesea mexicana TaxID=516756 RepID=A0A310SEQ2_9HYME|nr:hypothetical protein WN48_08806 [Eufriesea mexicana]
MSQSEDVYAPEEPTPDIAISLLDIQMPETPESTKGQISDGDTPRLESPKMLKPVLGKLQAKKRLMAFANKFNVPSKIQNKSSLLQAHSTKASKSKSMSSDNGKSLQNDSSTILNVDSDSIQFHNRHSKEKILAIEEIRREESKSKMLLAEAMAAANLEEENYANRNGQNLLENVKIIRERNRQDEINVFHKNTSKSAIESKYSERRRYGREERRDSANRESRDYNGSKERYYKISHDKEQRRKDKDKKDDKDKREDNNKYEESRDRKDEERDKKDNDRDKWEDAREKKGVKEKRECFKEKRSASQERPEIKDRREKEKEKDKDKGKEKDVINSASWTELKKSGIMMEDIIEIRRRDHSERSTKNRTAEDYLRHFEQMLMLNDCRLKRYAFIAEGLDGPKEYPPESIKLTKRGRPQLFYSENPRMSLFINHQQILQAIITDQREKMQEICDANFIRNDEEEEEAEKPQGIRNWYPKSGICKSDENTKWHVSISVQLPRSKWDSEDEDRLSNDSEQEQDNETKSSNIALEQEAEEFSPQLSTIEDVSEDKKIINEDEAFVKKINNNRQSASPLLQSAGNEKLASEYEQFMKMVCSDIPVSKEFSPKPLASTLSYHDFNIETNLPDDNNFQFVEHSISGKSDKSDSSKIEEKYKSNESRQSPEKISKIEDDQVSSSSSHIQVQKRIRVESKNVRDKSESEDSKSIPSDWENVRIKVERMSDENSDSRETKKKKKQKKVISSSSESSSSSSSSDSEEEVKRKKRKRKISNDSDSLTDSDSSDSSTNSSDSSSSDDKRKKRKKKKRKAEKRKRKAKRIARTKKKRKRKVSSDSSSTDSSEDRRKKRVVNKKSKQKKEYSNKQDSSENIQKPPLESSSVENTKLIRTQVPLKKIKEEVKVESSKRPTDKHDVWSKEQELVRKTISNNDVHNKGHKDEEKRNKADERYLEEWEMESVIISQKGEKLSKNNVEKVENAEISNIRKVEKKDERNKKDDKSKKDERFKEKCPSINKEIMPGNLKIEEDTDGKKKRKREKEKKNSNEFLTDWEKESERISQQIMQDEIKLSKKQKKEKWGETEFDTLNVLSLTQLEREVSKRQLLADEWEVDSLEAVPNLMINKKKPTRTSKKLEKEVRYDKKTDTYISIEKETLKECKKRQDRLSAMRIWEEEQEEGEREAMMLLEQKNKRKNDDWDIEEESFLREKNDRKENIEDSITIMDSIHKEVNMVSKNVDTSMKHDVITNKKNKKSRWDMESQSGEKLKLKAPVMWEEECAEWTKVNKFDHKIDRASLECCDSILPKTKIKDENVCVVEQSRKSVSKNSTSSEIIDLFPRKPQDVDLLESSWTSDEHARSKLRIRSLDNNSQKDTFFDQTKELTPSKEQCTVEQLKDIFEIDVKLTKKNTELYSPSSPAGSQKSEDIEAFNNNHTSPLNRKESLLQDKPKNEILIKSDEEFVPNIPLQIKYRDGKYAKSTMIKKEFEEILGMQKAEDQTVQDKFDVKVSESSPDLSINESYPDSNYKSLRMDIFAEYESDESCGKLSNKNSETVSSSASIKGGDESNEGKAALKLIPKQLLVRRNNERVKTKLISDDPVQHAAALLTIQKKLRESHAVRNDIKNTSCEESSTEFKIECEKATNIHAPIAEVIPTEQTTITDVKVDSKDVSITVKTSIITKSESPGAVKLDFNEYKSGDKGIKLEEYKKSRPLSTKDVSDTESQMRSPSREQKKKSPSRRENREDKRISDRSKEKRDKKFDDRERGDKKDNRSSKQEYNESRRRPSPSGSRIKKRRSTSWERDESRSESHSRSWSRSRSKSPKKKEESLASSSTKEKRSNRMDDDRSGRSRVDDRRERSLRSPPRSNTAPYNKDHFKKHTSTKGDRDEWNRRKYDCMEREKETRSYEPIEVLRERNIDPDRHRDSRFRGDETDRSLWLYETENILRDGNESLDSYSNGQDLDLDYEEKAYYRDDSIERDIMEGPFRPSSKFKHRKSRLSTRRDRQWEKERESLDLDRHGHVRRSEKLPPSRDRDRSHGQGQDHDLDQDLGLDHDRDQDPGLDPSYVQGLDPVSQSYCQFRSPSVGRGRVSESSRERKDEHDNMKLNSCAERGRRIETIVQSVSGLSRDSTVLDSEMHIGDNMETVAAGFQYSTENEVGNEYYYTENNLTYPPCIDDTVANSPKRLSLDDRLELELGIKKQQDGTGVSNDYGDNFNSNVCYPSPPQQQQQVLYRQQPTVLQVGNVLQVVPADFNGIPAAHREPTNSSTAPIVRGSSQVVRVGNVLQVVPTSLDWSGGQPSSVDQSGGMMYSATVPQPSPVPSVPISVPVPVPVPMPVPAVPPTISSSTPVSTLSPVPLPISVPVPGPVPLPVTQTTFPRTEVASQILPVYNYEVILETRRKEQEERKRLREIRRKDKERRRIERINRRALQLLEKSNIRQSENTNQQKSPSLDPSVLKALRENEEHVNMDGKQTSSAIFEKDEEMPVVASSASTEEEEVPVEEDEEEEEEEEAEVEDDEEDEEEAEDDEEEEEEDDEKSRLNKLKNEVDEVTATIATDEMNKIQIDPESKEWPELPPPPLKGILVASGFRTSVPNGNLDDLSTPENESGDNTDKEGFEADKNESTKGENGENKISKLKIQLKKSKLAKLYKRKQRSKKSVQFADGIKPGEGTSPSGGEGDMPSPPPPTSGITRGGIRDARRSRSRKSSKQEKRTRPPKTKKKVKVKIIKLKKPRVTPLTAMMMDDSDELDDRSPPPPPPGSPPPPHLWPSYLSAYNAINRTSETQSTTLIPNTVQAPPPPTPLPLLVPPPPLNYTIQPCSKA